MNSQVEDPHCGTQDILLKSKNRTIKFMGPKQVMATGLLHPLLLLCLCAPHLPIHINTKLSLDLEFTFKFLSQENSELALEKHVSADGTELPSFIWSQTF